MMFKLRRLGAWPTWRFLTSITSLSMRSAQKVFFTVFRFAKGTELIRISVADPGSGGFLALNPVSR